MYCIPKIIQKHSSFYIICVGWYGREYLYRHLVDEFWEIDERQQCLREYSIAFKSDSKNIEKIEKSLINFGTVYKGSLMGQICLGDTCRNCKNFWNNNLEDLVCPICKSDDIEKGILKDISFHKKFAVKVPRPSLVAMNYVEKYLKPKSVGIFARGRVCYGRNLSSEFYVQLIRFLQKKGYNPIWLGEKQSILPCPVNDIVDFSSLQESRDLELTLALISKLEFTIQFWTASTRLSSMVDTPWILFESPDQIVGNGHEGMRIALTSDFNKKKIVLAQYVNVKNNESCAFDYAEQAINQIKENNWDDIIGPVEHPEIIRSMLCKQELWR